MAIMNLIYYCPLPIACRKGVQELMDRQFVNSYGVLEAGNICFMVSKVK
jgi:hypothetical protein